MWLRVAYLLAMTACWPLALGAKSHNGPRWVVLPPGELPGLLQPTPMPVGASSPSIPVETESPTLSAAQASPSAASTPRRTAWLQQPVYAGLSYFTADFNISARAPLNGSFAALPAMADAVGFLSNTSVIAVSLPSSASVTASPRA